MHLLQMTTASRSRGRKPTGYRRAHNGTLTARIVARGGNNLAAFDLSA